MFPTKENFLEFLEKNPLVSINGAGDPYLVEHYGLEDDPPKNLLTVAFEDVPWERDDSITPAIAEEIIKFTDQKVREGHDSIYVHCQMGISRSGAVGTVLCERYGMLKMDFAELNDIIRPNPYVMYMMDWACAKIDKIV